MVPQVVLPPEGFAADVAGERPLVSVGPLVDHDVVGLGELPVTELADEPLLGSGGPALTCHVEPRVVGGRRGRGGDQPGVTQPLLEEESLADPRVEREW